ncbi:phage baseplate assembly protein V [Brevundimonas sp.]|uniref:phage baseplate assembly protein V n=1 Tax=Brevundimonas sp. TaxID=1871086 RepID=UPI0025B7E96A|nr:phage baseplate assembly protein V [Brevundimonas sp.]MCG2663361.1 phage baseplate assembly protein V [Brevundimonas sp.]
MTDAFILSEQGRRQANGLLFGVIETIDYEARRATVLFEEDWISAPLPWLERRAGAQRTSAPPSKGEQVAVLSLNGDPAAGLILPGVPSATFKPSDIREGLDLFETEGGYRDQWDEDAKTRTIELPAGGRLDVTIAGSKAVEVNEDEIKLSVGDLTFTLGDGALVFAIGGSAVARLTNDKITLKADVVLLDGEVDLGGEGGQPVARQNDAISTQLSRIIAGSGKVRAK